MSEEKDKVEEKDAAVTETAEDETKNQDAELEALNDEFFREMDIQGADISEGDRHLSEEKKKKLSDRKKVSKKKKKIRPFHVLVAILCLILALAVIGVGILLFLRSQGESMLRQGEIKEDITAPDGVQIEEDGKYVIYNGEKYCYNEHIINILCMGIDTSIQGTEEGVIGENGQADAIILAVIDTQTGQLHLVNISRDSMVDVNRYNVEGKYLGTEKMQLCLAYSYGDGEDDSCLNTARSVSRLMYGMPIHAWAAIDYSGISVLNDEVGGVTVEVLEDLSSKDPALVAGRTVTLTGQQAHTYVRTRDTSLLESNNQRMARQKQYMTAFLKTFFSKTKSDLTLPLKLYQNAAGYMVTDIGPQETVYLSSLVLQKGFTEGNMDSVPGQIVQGEVYAEFIPDDKALYELILKVFYTKIDE